MLLGGDQWLPGLGLVSPRAGSSSAVPRPRPKRHRCGDLPAARAHISYVSNLK